MKIVFFLYFLLLFSFLTRASEKEHGDNLGISAQKTELFFGVSFTLSNKEHKCLGYQEALHVLEEYKRSNIVMLDSITTRSYTEVESITNSHLPPKLARLVKGKIRLGDSTITEGPISIEDGIENIKKHYNLLVSSVHSESKE